MLSRPITCRGMKDVQIVLVVDHAGRPNADDVDEPSWQRLRRATLMTTHLSPMVSLMISVEPAPTPCVPMWTWCLSAVYPVVVASPRWQWEKIGRDLSKSSSPAAGTRSGSPMTMMLSARSSAVMERW